MRGQGWLHSRTGGARRRAWSLRGCAARRRWSSCACCRGLVSPCTRSRLCCSAGSTRCDYRGRSGSEGAGDLAGCGDERILWVCPGGDELPNALHNLPAGSNRQTIQHVSTVSSAGGATAPWCAGENDNVEHLRHCKGAHSRLHGSRDAGHSAPGKWRFGSRGRILGRQGRASAHENGGEVVRKAIPEECGQSRGPWTNLTAADEIHTSSTSRRLVLYTPEEGLARSWARMPGRVRHSGA